MIGINIGIPGDSAQHTGLLVPSEISTAILKLSPSSIVHSGGSVTSWTNNGTAASSLDVSPGTAPSYSSTGGKFGGAAVSFDGSTQYLVSSAYTWNQPSTVIVRTAWDGVSGPNAYIVDGENGNSRVVRIYSGKWAAYAGIALPGPVDSTAWTDVGVIFDDANSNSGINVDGSIVTGNVGTNSASGLAVGAYPGGPSQYYGGTVDWILGWDYALSSDQLATVINWLSTYRGSA